MRNHREIHRKAFYLIGNYEEGSEMTCDRICEEYGIRPDRLAVVPHSVALMDAASKGMLIPLLMRCFHSEKGDGLYPLATKLRDLTEAIFEWLGEEDTSDACERETRKKPQIFVADGSRGLYASHALGQSAGIR